VGWLSDLLGGSSENRAIADAMAKIRQLVEDENFQNSLLHPAIRDTILNGAAIDSLPDATGEFGYCLSNPIPVNGSIGELAYLSKIETMHGQRLLFHRLGSIDSKDVFECVAFDGSEWFILFADLYHPRRSRLTPKGFRFSKEFGQFSGFHNFCHNFPYDFREKRHSKNNELSLAYIASGKVQEGMDRRAYQRPLAHKLKLELIRSRLQGMRTVGDSEHDESEHLPARNKPNGEPPLPVDSDEIREPLIEILRQKYAKFPVLAQDKALVPAVDVHYLRLYPQMRMRHSLQEIVDEAFRQAFPPNGVPKARQ
jgi:hypothetical protein